MGLLMSQPFLHKLWILPKQQLQALEQETLYVGTFQPSMLLELQIHGLLETLVQAPTTTQEQSSGVPLL